MRHSHSRGFESGSRKGWVYVISNPAMPGLVKVGFSMKDPELRAVELSSSGVAHPYEVDYDVLVHDPRSVECSAHWRLAGVREGKEWFRCSPEKAIAEIQTAAGSNNLMQSFKRADRKTAEEIRQKQEAEQQSLQALASKKFRIAAAYDERLRSELPQTNFGNWCLGLFIAMFAGISTMFPKTSEEACFVFAGIGALFVTVMITNAFEEAAKKSPHYLALVRERDCDLEALDREHQNKGVLAS